MAWNMISYRTSEHKNLVVAGGNKTLHDRTTELAGSSSYCDDWRHFETTVDDQAKKLLMWKKKFYGSFSFLRWQVASYTRPRKCSRAMALQFPRVVLIAKLSYCTFAQKHDVEIVTKPDRRTTLGPYHDVACLISTLAVLGVCGSSLSLAEVFRFSNALGSV